MVHKEEKQKELSYYLELGRGIPLLLYKFMDYQEYCYRAGFHYRFSIQSVP
jgi:hypothetical protein